MFKYVPISLWRKKKCNLWRENQYFVTAGLQMHTPEQKGVRAVSHICTQAAVILVTGILIFPGQH